jgi:hypothetical protein
MRPLSGLYLIGASVLILPVIWTMRETAFDRLRR